MGFSNAPLPSPTRWKQFRLTVMKLATVERLQLLWGLLALFGTMSWLSLMPAYAFRNKVDEKMRFQAPSYSFFLAATSQRALLPRIINHPWTQTATILISVLLTILNFFSWIILASDKDFGAKTDCQSGLLSDRPGYVAQCRGVNVAIVLGVVVFLLWIPISVVIVCGTIDRGLWWWGEDDGWAQGEAIVGGSNMMSEEEFDRKIGVGGSKQIKRRQTVHPESLTQQRDMVMIQQPKPAFVTPIASQFRSSSALGLDLEDGDGGDEDDDYTTFTPSSYRKHHQQRQRQQEPRRLNRRGSNTSLSSRLSTFFGAGWNSGTMPLSDSEPPMPQIPSQYRQGGASTPQQNHSSSNISGYSNTNNNTNNNANGNRTNGRKENSPPRKKAEPKREVVPEPEPEDDGSLHGDAYTSQWHSRRHDDWS
ncbi:hypothetical protein BG011_005807 [Mortierella polycephala]|uniref:Uncharacterized protein n=1 Tax=Mortierella polycephala TaxID=41804 RepID=A0A9P6U0T3_9FUNG|nr:hypothetical protein BG011_005807 [Mortierella polycephala]